MLVTSHTVMNPTDKEEREAPLLRMHAYGRSRVTSETADERQGSLQRLHTNQHERLAAEPKSHAKACVCAQIEKMVLPQARPTILGIHEL